jgi:hypothetical protein
MGFTVQRLYHQWRSNKNDLHKILECLNMIDPWWVCTVPRNGGWLLQCLEHCLTVSKHSARRTPRLQEPIAWTTRRSSRLPDEVQLVVLYRTYASLPEVALLKSQVLGKWAFIPFLLSLSLVLGTFKLMPTYSQALGVNPMKSSVCRLDLDVSFRTTVQRSEYFEHWRDTKWCV